MVAKATAIPNIAPTRVFQNRSVSSELGAASRRSYVPVRLSSGITKGPAAADVKNTVKASRLAIPASALIPLRTEKEKNIKNGINKPNMIIPGLK